MKKVGFLFGAGAEIAYGLPKGGELALDIFKSEYNGKEEIKNAIDKKIDWSSIYACNWIPDGIQNKIQIPTFGKTEYSQIINSTLENKREIIINYLKTFDAKAKELSKSEKFKLFNIEEKLYTLSGKKIGTYSLEKEIEMNTAFDSESNLFASKYFSLFLLILKVKTSKTDIKKIDNLKKIVKAFLELWVGAVGNEYLQKLNTEIFTPKKGSAEIDVLNNYSNLFSFNNNHISCFELFYSNTDFKCGPTDSNEKIITFFAYSLLRKLMEESMNYQVLIDSYYSYLFNPKSEWSKFCKISNFLYGVKKYITKEEDSYKKKAKGDGYYKDLLNFDKKKFDLVLGTTNYNHLIEENGLKDVYYLNGSVDDYFDPYLNAILSKEENKKSKHITVPLLFTQSGIKPITSVSMTERYYKYFSNLDESDIIIVIGFGFNSDDGHINGMFRELLKNKKHIVIFDYSNLGKDFFIEKLRLEDIDSTSLDVLPIDKDRKTEGQFWYKKIQSLMS